MNKSVRYSPEVRERAVRLVLEHQGEHESQWAAISLDCVEDRLHRGDVAQDGCARPSGIWQAGGDDHIGA
jgi:hypothetical protein